MKKHFNKELAMTKENDEDLETFLTVGFVINFMLRMMLK